jgi:hypothetical protein
MKKNINNVNNLNSLQPKLVIPFYTQERWQNWTNKVKESGFKLGADEKGAIFVYMEDDIVLACLKVIAKYDKKLISNEEALKYITDIKEIVLKKIEPITEDIDMMLESTQTSLIGVFASCESYINKKYHVTKSFDKLLKTALKAEKDGDIEIVLGAIAEIGANILAGGKLKEKDFENVPEGIVAEWLDGIDCLNAAMVGDTSYKDDEPDEGD